MEDKNINTETVEVPSFYGYECVGIHVPDSSLYILSPCADFLIQGSDSYACKQLCYRKIKPKRYVFEETGEFREAELDEYVLDSVGGVVRWFGSTKTPGKYKILRKIEDE